MEVLLLLFQIPTTRELVWFAVFWCVLVLIGCLEVFWPTLDHDDPRRSRWPTNFGLGLVNATVATIAPMSIVLAAEWGHRHGLGALQYLSLPWWGAALVTILLRSLSGYTLHVLFHKVPVLWRVHRVHHADTHL